MAGTRLPSILLDLCTAQVNSITGIEAYQGRKIWDEDASVENEVRGLLPEEQGRMWLWINSRQSQTYPWQPYHVEIGGELLLRLPRGTSSVCDKLYDTVELVAMHLDSLTAFTAVPAVPYGCIWTQVDDGSPEDDVVRFQFTVTYKVGPSCEV